MTLMSHPKTTKLQLYNQIVKKHKDLIMFIDIFFANGNPFYMSKTKKMNFITKFDKLNHLKNVKSILWNVVLGIEEIH